MTALAHGQPSRAKPHLAVLATSARMLAELAAGEGYAVTACDLYGDADTRAVATGWASLKAQPSSGIDAARVLAALDTAAAVGAVGWVAGSGFDALPDVLAAGAARLPLFGAGAATVQRLRDWRWFFNCADAHGIAHPAVRGEAPADATGWLRKDAASTGGWGVVDALAAGRIGGDVVDAVAAGKVGSDAVDAPVAARGRADGVPTSTRYWQRRIEGTSMSATVLAGDGDVLVLGHNRQCSVRIGDRPHVHAGLIGPVGVPAQAAADVLRAARLLAAESGLRGLASLDYVLDPAGGAQVLEINPRPSASSAVYGEVTFVDTDAAADHGHCGLIAAHIVACRQGRVLRPRIHPKPAPAYATRTVYAPRTLALGAAALRLLQAWPCCHDRPAAPVVVGAGEPLCTLTARGDAHRLAAHLALRHQQILIALGDLT